MWPCTCACVLAVQRVLGGSAIFGLVLVSAAFPVAGFRGGLSSHNLTAAI